MAYTIEQKMAYTIEATIPYFEHFDTVDEFESRPICNEHTWATSELTSFPCCVHCGVLNLDGLHATPHQASSTRVCIGQPHPFFRALLAQAGLAEPATLDGVGAFLQVLKRVPNSLRRVWELAVSHHNRDFSTEARTVPRNIIHTAVALKPRLDVPLQFLARPS